MTVGVIEQFELKRGKIYMNMESRKKLENNILFRTHGCASLPHIQRVRRVEPVCSTEKDFYKLIGLYIRGAFQIGATDKFNIETGFNRCIS